MPTPTEPQALTQAAPYTLTFVEWECGHHMQRPADIPVHSPEQALLILQAISHAISQPGSARAILLTDDAASGEVYLCDDYVDPGAQSILQHRYPRPIIAYGDAAAIAALQHADLADAWDDLIGGEPLLWDGEEPIYSEGGVVLFVGTLQELQDLMRVPDPFEQHCRYFDVPPTFMPAAEVRAMLGESQAEMGGRSMSHIRPLRSYRLQFACGRTIQLKASSADAATHLGAAVTGRQPDEVASVREMMPVTEGGAA